MWPVDASGYNGRNILLEILLFHARLLIGKHDGRWTITLYSYARNDFSTNKKIRVKNFRGWKYVTKRARHAVECRVRKDSGKT